MESGSQAGTDKSLNAFGAVGCPHLARFRKFCGVLFDVYGIKVGPPELAGTGEVRLSSFKEFLSGLVERRNHPWRVALLRLGIRSRLSIAHSLFLFRKTLPSKKPDLDSFLDQVSTPADEPDEKFMHFCRTEIRKMFKIGWDRSIYPSKCLSTSVSTSSCAENGRMFGGARQWVLDSKMPDIADQQEFVLATLSRAGYARPCASRLVAVETAGKWRKITVPSGNFSLLRPLHNSIYSHITRQDWLLHGKESANRFKKFTYVNGELFVSGDYESATDFLNTNVSKGVLAEILMQSRSVPAGISCMAMDSLSLPVRLKREDSTHREVEQKSGQMMGYLLSFPLLCIINYLTFKYAVPRDVPVKINGDDIVFRGTREEYEVWADMVSKSGLKLSRGKTMLDRRFFTLNSSLFSAEGKKVKALPFIRSTALFPKSKDPEAVMSIRGRFASFAPGFCGEKRWTLRCSWLRINRSMIDVTRRSCSRGLGLCVDYPMLVKAGLWDREAWHLALQAERCLPAPFSEWSHPPKGYKYIRVPTITKEIRARSEGLSAAFVEAAWQTARSDNVSDWFTEMQEATYNWVDAVKSRQSRLKRAKLLGVSSQNLERYLRPRRSLFDPESFKSIKHGVWVSEDYTSTWFAYGWTEGVFGPASEETHRPIRDLPKLTRRTCGAADPLIDVRDYIDMKVDASRVIVGSKEGNIIRSTAPVEVSGGKHKIILRPSDDGAVRVYSRGIGIGPPKCLI